MNSPEPNGGKLNLDVPASGSGENEAPQSQQRGLFNWLRRLISSNEEGGLRETLEEVIDEHGDTTQTLDPDQREMLGNIVAFGELQVDDIMVPRTDIIGIDASSPLSELLSTFLTARHSRLPVYRGNLDDIAGFVHIKDVIDFWDKSEAFSLQRIVRQLLIVPPSMPAVDLLARMRSTRLHMAIVVDEYGGTDGLVTIEDVVEKIVGDIEDEHDVHEAPLLIELDNQNIEADGRAEINDLENLLGVDLLPDEVDEEVGTLGGLVFAMLGRIPDTGEIVKHDCGLEIEVTDADARRIKKLLLRRPSPKD